MAFNKNISIPSKGLVTDVNPNNQPPETYRFALNAIGEREDAPFLSNEESNEPCHTLREGYIPIGKVYIGNNENVIFSVSEDGTTSEIGIVNNKCEYELKVNSSSLGFKVTHQIDATYRLRRGCQRVIYWVDDLNKPRIYDLDDPEDFKTDGRWNKNKFDLIKDYEKIPELEVEVQNIGGALKPGSYNISIQYLDEDLNPTEWILTTEIVNIYNNSLQENFLGIHGSINREEIYFQYPETTKCIKVVVNDLDDTFIFYRLAFIEAASGTGQVTRVDYTNHLSIKNNKFIYTGLNGSVAGTEEEILFNREHINTAQSIEQVENRLILANTKGKDINYCKLQKYASKIKSNLIFKNIHLNVNSDKRNPKNPTVKLEGIGYMPGEVYSFGIVYVFKDGDTSPVYHIPGLNPNIEIDRGEAPQGEAWMSSEENISQSTRYTDTSNCDEEDYWGNDADGNPLKGELVRHHRFPLRSKVGKNLVSAFKSSNEEEEDVTHKFYMLKLTVSSFVDGENVKKTQVACPQVEDQQANQPDQGNQGEGNVQPEPEPEPEPEEECVDPENIRVSLSYTNNFRNFEQDFEIVVSNYEADEDGNSEIFEEFYSQISNVNDFSTIVIKEDDGGVYQTGTESAKKLQYTYEIIETDEDLKDKLYKSDIFGIKFSNIDLPILENTDEEIIGYYIVRNERKEDDKTILDSAVLAPTIKSVKGDYLSHGLICPQFNDNSWENRIEKNIFAMIHPEHKFREKEYKSITEIVDEGTYVVQTRRRGFTRYLDVLDGSSHTSAAKDDDDDGWSIKMLARDNEVNFTRHFRESNEPHSFEKKRDNIKEIVYLDALDSKRHGDQYLYNISADNKIGFIEYDSLEDADLRVLKNKLKYVYLKRELEDYYPNFRTDPYIKVSNKVEEFTEDKTCTVFGGDTYISPMRYFSTVFWDNRIAKRRIKSGIGRIIIGALLSAVAIVGTILLPGSAPATLRLLSFAISLVSAGVKANNVKKAYYSEYKKGLQDCVLDQWINSEFKYQRGHYQDKNVGGPADDEIQWAGDCVSDLWFETTVNMGLRIKMATGEPSFMSSPGILENLSPEAGDDRDSTKNKATKDNKKSANSTVETYLRDKLLYVNKDRKGGYEYKGHPSGELYELNEDYQRSNTQKVFFHLPLEYDCCSSCREIFPHRVYYSEQTFSEELTDNFRMFLPNNYRNIEGNTGHITDLFRFREKLFIHTEEGLWQLQEQYQERITDEVVSFVGTGSYFAIPPRRIGESSQASGGCKHKWATIKTEFGVFFVSEIDLAVYLFDGEKLNSLSNLGLFKWFRDNLNFKFKEDSYRLIKKEYDLDNNPSNRFGIGFISTYDKENNRIILTKKDFQINDSFEGVITSTPLENRNLKGLNNSSVNNNSFTISFNLLTQSWISYHSYLPDFYIHNSSSFYSWKRGNNRIWKHNRKGFYQNFYEERFPHIIEYVSTSKSNEESGIGPFSQKTWEFIELQTEAKSYNHYDKEFIEDRKKTFNKIIMYNSSQCTGELEMIVKERDQVLNPGQIFINKKEKKWFLNEIRDFRIDYNTNIFKSNILSLQNNYYIDKVLNVSSIDFNKNWMDREYMKDKYLIIRLKFDDSDNIKLITNFSFEIELESIH